MSLLSDPNADPNGSGERKPSDRTGENIPHRLGGFEFGVGGYVGIGVQCEARGVMTQHGGDRFHIHAILERHRCESVSEVMEADTWQSRPFQDSLQHVQNAVRGHGPPGG